MGEYAEMMLDGTLCEGCGTFLGGGSPGYPRYCRSCQPKPKGKTKPALPTTDEAVQAVIDAARAVLEEADHKHDTMAPPCKYIAPYGSLAKLRAALAGLETAG